FTYFSTMFKKYTGVTPNEYRKNLNVDTKEE
ncbi:MAG: AraC family transcriptional regulator, partial [Neglectibacter timonensis]